MAVLKKIRSRLFSTPGETAPDGDGETRALTAGAGDAPEAAPAPAQEERYDIRPLTIS